MCFFAPSKHKESFGFLMFLRGLEMQYWAKIGPLYVVPISGSYFVRKLYMYVKFSTLKPFFAISGTTC